MIILLRQIIFIISECRLTKYAAAFSIILSFMMIAKTTYSQSSLDMFGYAANSGNSQFRLNSFEGNPQNYSQNKSWELSFIYGGEYVNSFSSNIYLIGISKQIDDHNIYARFTPGIQKEFIFKSGSSLLSSDSSEVQLQSDINYEEAFGFGYSYKLTSKLTAGFNLRFFKQTFFEEEFDPFFSIDSQNIIRTESVETTNNYWRGDVGVVYSPSEKINISISSANLIIMNENSESTDLGDYKLRTDKKAIIGVEYLPVKSFSLTGKVETDDSFLFGVSKGFKFGHSNFSVGLAAFHDKYQNPFIAGFLPTLNYSTDFISLTLSGVQYLTDRTEVKPLSDFLNDGINNLLNNQYSGNKYFLSANLALSFTPEKGVRFIDLKINEEIFPTLEDLYIDKPFAEAKVLNITNKAVTVKPSSFIPLINKEEIFSPPVLIAAGDSGMVQFFTIIHENSKTIKKREIGEANFYLTTESSTPDDEMQKPLLVNDYNAWNGRVEDLRYFVKQQIEYSHFLSKKILSEKKVLLNKTPAALTEFEKVKILFEHFSENMIYVSDPRGSAERVQFPKETFEVKGGDCDDLSVCFSSMLEGVGIQTAFVDYIEPDGISHVNLLVNTGLAPEYSYMITNNDKKYFIRKNTTGKEEIWIPVETTSQGDFEKAWKIASEKFHSEAVNKLGLAKGSVRIIDIY